MKDLAPVSNDCAVGVTMTPCWQCETLIGVMPAVYQHGKVHKICCDCYLDWQPFMHVPGCGCEHHEWCATVIALESVPGDSIPYGL